jgi:hypothetical protein
MTSASNSPRVGVRPFRNVRDTPENTMPCRRREARRAAAYLLILSPKHFFLLLVQELLYSIGRSPLKLRPAETFVAKSGFEGSPDVW